jgi:hypothetical protein
LRGVAAVLQPKLPLSFLTTTPEYLQEGQIYFDKVAPKANILFADVIVISVISTRQYRHMQSMKKYIFTALSLVSASALLVLALGCTTTTAQTQNEQDLLIAAGFKAVSPKNAAQQQKLQSLPPGHLAMITKGGQTYYVFPDAANNRALVGGPRQYQSYQQYRLAQKLSAEQLETAQAYQDASMNWGSWGGWGMGWGGWY